MKPYYESGGITIYHGDCKLLLPALGARPDAVITDPPYSAATHAGARTGDGDEVLVDFAPIGADTLRHVLGICSPRRWTVATMDWHHVAPLATNPPSGARFVRFGVWHKPNGSPQFTGDRPGQGWEAVGIFHNETGPMHWNGGGRTAVWRVNKVNSAHPTGKPIDLVQDFVALFTDAGELVVDPFAGGGTTLIAAKNLRRRAIGIEIEERYCEIAARRLDQEVLAL